MQSTSVPASANAPSNPIAPNLPESENQEPENHGQVIDRLCKIASNQKKMIIALLFLTLVDVTPRLYSHFEWQFAQPLEDNLFVLGGSLLIIFASVIFYVLTTIKFSRMFNNSKSKTGLLAVLAVINAFNIIPYLLLSMQSHRELKPYGLNGFAIASKAEIRKKVMRSLKDQS